MSKMIASTASDLDVTKVADTMNSESERYAQAQAEMEKAYRQETDSVIELCKKAQDSNRQQNVNDQDIFVSMVARVPARAAGQVIRAVENHDDHQVIKPKMRLYWAGFLSGICLCAAIIAVVGITVMV